MANTVTSYTTFVSGSKAKAEEMNANLDNHRGTLIPINTDSASAADEGFDLGSTDYRWNNAYFRTWQFKSTSTLSNSKMLQDSTGNLVFDLPAATDYNIQINSVTVFQMRDSGTSSKYIKARFFGETSGAVVMNGATTSFQGFTVPCTFDHTGAGALITIGKDSSFGRMTMSMQNGRVNVDLMEGSGTTVTSMWIGENTTTSPEIYFNPCLTHIQSSVNTLSANFYLQFQVNTGTSWNFGFRGALRIKEML